MTFEDRDLGDMLSRRSGRGSVPDASELATAAISQRPRRLAFAPRVVGRAAPGIAIGVAALLAIGAIAAARLQFDPERTPTPSGNATSSASSSPLTTPAASSSPLVVVPREPPGAQVQLKQVLGAAVTWGGESRSPTYAACAIDEQDRVLIALTVPGTEEWTAHTVLPVRPPPGDVARCLFGVADSSLIAFTMVDPGVIERAWLVSDVGARELDWDQHTNGTRYARSSRETVLAVLGEGDAVVEIDRDGTLATWPLPDVRPEPLQVEIAAVDPLRRRWLVTRRGSLVELWMHDRLGWREKVLLGGNPAELWFDDAADPGAVISMWDDSRGPAVSTVSRVAPAVLPRDAVNLPNGAQPVGLLGSGKLVAQQMSWLRVEQSPGEICVPADPSPCRWLTLTAGLDEGGALADGHFVTVAGDSIVVTGRDGVRVIPASNARPLSDTDDSGPLPMVKPPESPIDLTLRDRTGLVTAYSAFAPSTVASKDGKAVVMNKEGRGRVLWVAWTTWHCERKPTVEVLRDGGAYTIRVNTGPHPSGGCDTVPGNFGVELRLRASIDAELVRTIFEDPPP
jgi:hypothetical protein